MNEQEIGAAIDPKFKNVYGVTIGPTTLIFKDGSTKVGFFHNTNESQGLKSKNIFTFVEFVNAQNFRATYDKKYVTLVNGDDLQRVVYSQLVQVKFSDLFKTEGNGMLTPLIPIRMGGITVGNGISFGGGVSIGGLNLLEYSSSIVNGYVDNGIFVVTSFDK